MGTLEIRADHPVSVLSNMAPVEELLLRFPNYALEVHRWVVGRDGAGHETILKRALLFLESDFH